LYVRIGISQIPIGENLGNFGVLGSSIGRRRKTARQKEFFRPFHQNTEQPETLCNAIPAATVGCAQKGTYGKIGKNGEKLGKFDAL